MTGRPPLPLGAYGSISVRSLPNGTFRARTRFRDFDGRTVDVVRHGGTKAAAERTLKAALAERTLEGQAEGLGASSRFSQVADQWLLEVAGDERLAPSTRSRYNNLVEQYLDPALGELRCREVTVPVVDRFLRTVRANNGASTAKGCRSVLSSVVKYAMRQGAMTTNPVRDAGVIRTERKQSRALTDDEAGQLLGALEADPWAVQRDLPDLCRFLDGTGLRIGEACALRVEDFDLEAGTVEVRATAGHQGRQERTKSDAGWRVLALPPALVELVQRRVENDDLATTIAVFPSMTGRLRDPSNTAADLRRAFDAAGFDWVTSHTFRRTVATRLDAAGLSARAVADHLGHAQPSMTLDVYMGRKVVSSQTADVLSRDFPGTADGDAAQHSA